jgi:hypothetical protein
VESKEEKAKTERRGEGRAGNRSYGRTPAGDISK